MPSASISAGPSAAKVRCSCSSARRSACSASATGVSSFGGALARSRARFVRSATSAARSAAARRPSLSKWPTTIRLSLRRSSRSVFHRPGS